jgi:hypothetical protein
MTYISLGLQYFFHAFLPLTSAAIGPLGPAGAHRHIIKHKQLAGRILATRPQAAHPSNQTLIFVDMEALLATGAGGASLFARPIFMAHRYSSSYCR